MVINPPWVLFMRPWIMPKRKSSQHIGIKDRSIFLYGESLMKNGTNNSIESKPSAFVHIIMDERDRPSEA
jgi:hypothetical protein